jgi:hypothetical protein
MADRKVYGVFAGGKRAVASTRLPPCRLPRLDGGARSAGLRQADDLLDHADIRAREVRS